jgi:pyruvate dehydrogenase E2 component (dihydrolipoamide acetyltransferase)
MIERIELPQADANLEEATVGAWLVTEGATVGTGDVLAEMITDKGVIEIESPCDGVIRRIVAPERSVVPVGYVLALIGEEGDKLPEVDAGNRELLARHQALATPARLVEGERPREPRPTTLSGGPTRNHARQRRSKPARVRATPAAKRLAREHDIDLAEVQNKFAADVVNESMVSDFLDR